MFFSFFQCHYKLYSFQNPRIWGIYQNHANRFHYHCTLSIFQYLYNLYILPYRLLL